MRCQVMLKSTEFELLPNSPDVRVVTRGASLAALPGLTLTLVAYVTGWFSGETALFCGIGFLLLTAVFYWWIRGTSRGVVEVNADRLLVRTRSGRQVYAWTDIAEIRLNTMRQTATRLAPIFAAVAGADPDLPFVELKLKRLPRVGLVFNEFGSLRFGIPRLMGKSVGFYAKDSEGLVQAAQSHLGAGPSP